MSTKKVSDGNIIPHTPGSAVVVNQVIEFGTDAGGFIGVALAAIAAGAVGPVAIAGVFELTKATGASTGWTQGDPVYWTGTALTAVSTANHLAGIAWETVADGVALGKVLLVPSAV